MPLFSDPKLEEYRLSKLREAMAIPRTKEWRENQSKGIRKARAEGKMQTSPEERARVARMVGEKLRGRTRPGWVVEKVRKANLGKKRSPEQIERMKQSWAAARDAGKYYISPERRREICRKAGETKKKNGWRPSLEQRSAHALKMKGRKCDPSHVAKRAMALKGIVHVVPGAAKGPLHLRAISGLLRNPEGVIHAFRNLVHFVRENHGLFSPDDTVWNYSRPSSPWCRASKGLSGLFNRGVYTRGSWKGWTRVSDWEIQERWPDLISRFPLVSFENKDAYLSPALDQRPEEVAVS